MTSYDTLHDGMAINVSYREDEVRRYVTVTDKMTGREFSASYPRSFEYSAIIEIIVDNAVAKGEM